jgi:hypothetical protein
VQLAPFGSRDAPQVPANTGDVRGVGSVDRCRAGLGVPAPALLITTRASAVLPRGTLPSRTDVGTGAATGAISTGAPARPLPGWRTVPGRAPPGGPTAGNSKTSSRAVPFASVATDVVSPAMAVGDEQLRVVERRVLPPHAVVGEGIENGDG